jgi:bacteriocin biosynthesis cyclodehydratase domain-containing protein
MNGHSLSPDGRGDDAVPAEQAIVPVHLFTMGPFGEAVARRLRSFRTDIMERGTDLGTRIKGAPTARINVFATWRPAPDLCELLDLSSHEDQCPFLPLVIDSASMYLGPVSIPGRGSCWNCWTVRSSQQEHWPGRRLGLSKFYTENPTAGPSGYLEPFAMIAAARISQAIDALDRGTMAGGQLWEMDLMTRVVTTSVVVAVHRCPRCGLRLPPETRSVGGMQQALSYLWRGSAGK